MRVALLVTDLERGGTPLRLARLARGLRDADVGVHVGCLAPPGPISHDLEADGIPTYACDAAGPQDFMAFKRLADHVRRIRPDLIHATLMHANVAARLIGSSHGLPVVTATATIEVERRWHRAVESATTRVDAAHIVNSRAVARHVTRTLGIPAKQVFVVPPSLERIPQPLDPHAARDQLDIPPHEFVVAWAGRLDPVKRLDLIIQCAEILTDLPTRFLLAGDGPYRTHLQKLLRLSSAADRIHLLGWQDNLLPLLSAADAFIFPSLTEGMPNAVLEAMACGVPIVASDIPVLRELSDDGQRFRIIAGDRAIDYAAVLRELHDDHELRIVLGDRARRWAQEHLDPRATVRAVMRVYRYALERRQRP